MAIYSVIMEQAVTVADLRNHTLMTGHGDVGDRIQSCSAVTMVNTNTWAAGLYHFPAGSINADQQSADLLRAMRHAIAPTEAYVHWGVAPLQQANMGFNIGDGPVRAHLAECEQLRAFVLRLLPLESRLRRMPANTGYISVTANHGAVAFDDQDIDPTADLRDVGHNPGGVPGVYWRASY